MNVADLRNAHHTLQETLDSKKYCCMTSFCGSLTYYYLRIGMGFHTSPGIWQQLLDTVFENILNEERHKIIMADAMIFSMKKTF